MKHKLFVCIYGALTVVMLFLSALMVSSGQTSFSDVFITFAKFIIVGVVIYFTLECSRKVKETPLTPKVEQARKDAEEHAKQAEQLVGPPCRVALLWKKHTGSSAKNIGEAGTDITKARVFLNGECQKQLLEIGSPMKMQTNLKQNKLIVAHRCGIEEARVDSLSFEAEPGKRYLIMLDYYAGTLTFIDDDEKLLNRYVGK